MKNLPIKNQASTKLQNTKEGNPFQKFLRNKELITGAIIVLLGAFLIYASWPFITAFIGAAIIAYIFRPLNKILRNKYKFSRTSSAVIILILSLIIVILPIIFIINGLINQIYFIPGQLAKVSSIKEQITRIFPLNIDITMDQVLSQLASFLTSMIKPIISDILSGVIILVILFFTLYYLIYYSDEITLSISEYLPFDEETNKKIIKKFSEVTNSTILGTFLIGIIQGFLLAFNFFMVGIPNAIFWGFVTMILCFVPMMGAPIIWVPAVLYLFITSQIKEGIALIFAGVLISTIDNVLRPIINSRYGSIHPLMSIIGIFIGISQFGIVGVFIGPLLVVYFVFFIKLYREKYAAKKDKIYQ